MTDLIVLNYNDFETTEKFLKSVEKYKILNHVIVVDNCSTDDSYSKLKQLEKNNIIVLEAGINRGYAAGNNIGAYYSIQHYNSDYIIIANPDIYIEEDAIIELIEKIKTLPDAGAVSCLMDCTSSVKLPVATKLPKFKDCLAENFIVAKKIFGNNLEYSNEYLNKDVTIKVDVLPGSFFIIKSKLFNKVGGFDERTFLYYEENILAYKLKQYKANNYLITDCKYIHDHSVSVDKSIKSVSKKLKIANRSRMIYCRYYLEISRFEQLLLRISFQIGLFNYLVAKKIQRVFK